MSRVKEKVVDGMRRFVSLTQDSRLKSQRQDEIFLFILNPVNENDKD